MKYVSKKLGIPYNSPDYIYDSWFINKDGKISIKNKLKVEGFKNIERTFV